MRFLILAVAFMSTIGQYTQPKKNETPVGAGHLPVVVSDAKGAVHMVYGHDSTLYYAVSGNPSSSFSQPLAVATLSHLVAGAKRGPQLAVTARYIVITAVNQVGDVFAYSQDRTNGKWSPAVRINDLPATAKEGFQAAAGAADGTFYATWLDLREDGQNKIMMAASHDGGRSWSANRVVYRSPSGSVCECCKVSIVANQNDVYIQFRNWLDGARDLYLAHSTDGGRSFAPPQKLGFGNWKLKACPMDGGAVSLATRQQPITAWRRENTVYTCRPGQAEQAVASGRNVTLTTHLSQMALAWDEAGQVWVKINDQEARTLGRGQMPSLAFSEKELVCVWESDGQIMRSVFPR